MGIPDSKRGTDLGKRLLLVAIPLVVLVTFWPVLGAQFIAWDDDANFLNNPHFRGLTWQNLRWMFTTLHMSNYQPLSWLFSGLGHSLWGMSPLGYHAASLGLHVLNAILFYSVATRLLRLVAPSSTDDAGLAVAAAIATLFFALHPLRVESVAWLSGQHDLLAGAFYLSAMLCYLRACAQGSRPRLWPAVLSFAAGMLCKSNGITLPFALLLLDIYPLRRLPLDPRQWLAPGHRRVWFEKLPFIAIALAAGWVSVVARYHTTLVQPLSLGFRIQQAFYGAVFYLGKTAVPLGLLPFYPMPVGLRLPVVSTAASVGVVLLLTAVVVHQRRRWPGAWVAWAYYLVTLLPVLGLISVSILLVADRYTYLPCLAWAVLGGALVLASWRRLARQYRRFLTTGLAAVLLLLAVLSFRQATLWRDSETLFRHVLSMEPDIPEVHNNLGFDLVNHGRFDEGMEEYRRALAIKPDFVKAMNNLGLALLSQGRIDEGIEQCQKALDLEPDYAFAHNNLGLALMYLGRAAEALPHFQRAVAVAPDYVTAYANLGSALLTLGRIDEAIAQFHQALELRPDYVAAATMLRAAEGQRAR